MKIKTICNSTKLRLIQDMCLTILTTNIKCWTTLSSCTNNLMACNWSIVRFPYLACKINGNWSLVLVGWMKSLIAGCDLFLHLLSQFFYICVSAKVHVKGWIFLIILRVFPFWAQMFFFQTYVTKIWRFYMLRIFIIVNGWVNDVIYKCDIFPWMH